MVNSTAVSGEPVVGPVGDALILGSTGAADEAGADGPVPVPVVPQALIPTMAAAEIRASARRWCFLFVVTGSLFMELTKEAIQCSLVHRSQ